MCQKLGQAQAWKIALCTLSITKLFNLNLCHSARLPPYLRVALACIFAEKPNLMLTEPITQHLIVGVKVSMFPVIFRGWLRWCQVLACPCSLRELCQTLHVCPMLGLQPHRLPVIQQAWEMLFYALAWLASVLSCIPIGMHIDVCQ